MRILTIGPWNLDEFVYHLTHDRTVDWLLPGVPPTGKKLSIPMLAVVNIRGDRLYNGTFLAFSLSSDVDDVMQPEHIWWDQATALRQAGVLPTHLPFPLPPQFPSSLTSSGDTTGMLRLPVAGVESAAMLIDESKGTSNEMFGSDWGIVKGA